MPISMKIRCYAVPALLCIVASIHVVRHHAYEQSSWGAGCGFGMFATIDYHGTRFLRAKLTANGAQAAAGFRSHFPDLDLRATVLPNQHNLLQYASALASERWQLTSTPEMIAVSQVGQRQPTERCFARADSLPPTEAKRFSKRPDHVELAVWGIRFRPAQRRVEAFPIRQVSLFTSHTSLQSEPLPHD